MPQHGEPPEIGRDALDPPLQAAADTQSATLLLLRRSALALGGVAGPTLSFILAGIALGPVGLGAVSTDALRYLDPVVSVALAILGIFVGLGFGGASSPGSRGLTMAALLQVALTVVIVGGAMYLLLRRWNLALPMDTALFAAVAGVCCCASAARRVERTASVTARRLSRVIDLEDLPLVLLGALAVAAVGTAPDPATHLLVTAAAAIGVGAAGWLLFERAESAAERGVFVTGAVLLLAGIGAYLATSPLLSGCVAGVLWVRTPGGADRIIGADLNKLQHPLVALLLIVAGASIGWDLTVLWIAAPLVLLRLTGKLAASLATARLTAVPTVALATVLVPPGVLGIAIALNVQQVLGSGDPLLLSGVTVAAAVSELTGVALGSEDADE